jgi:DNA-directed RNA polymerase sigma subunit (sigma70/sigma32)
MLDKEILLKCVFGRGVSAGARRDDATMRQLVLSVPDQALDDAVNALPRREKFVIEHRYTHPCPTFSDLAQITPRADGGTGVSTERARQMEGSALRQLEHALRKYL